MNSTARYGLSLLAAALLGAGAIAQPQEPLPAAAIEVPADEPGWFGGVGMYLIKPYFQYNPAYTVFSQLTIDTVLNPQNPTTQTVGERARRVDVERGMSAAPMAWIGYATADGLGLRARGWRFEDGTSQTVYLQPFAGAYSVLQQPGKTVIVASGNLVTVSSATPLGLQAFGDTLGIQHGPESVAFNVTTKLFVQVGDLEAFQRFRADDWSLTVAGGLRYARLDQTYNAFDAQSGGGGVMRMLLSSQQFSGLGPTLALEARRPLGESGLSVYGQCRGSIVFGTADQDAVFMGTELRNEDPNPQYAQESRNRAIPIFDIEAGLEYGRCLGRGRIFGQLGVVGQEWLNAGSASRSTMLNPASTLRPVLGGTTLDSNLAFLGLTLRVGVNY